MTCGLEVRCSIQLSYVGVGGILLKLAGQEEVATKGHRMHKIRTLMSGRVGYPSQWSLWPGAPLPFCASCDFSWLIPPWSCEMPGTGTGAGAGRLKGVWLYRIASNSAQRS